ncbi:MAG TPA: PEP-CTERM sorting domain-containing protein [Tepidisphaeraceae bacterium]|nr:PEP-CTERM sorting domain-containing protein [Tepidisphaeraceae bacterium]
MRTVFSRRLWSSKLAKSVTLLGASALALAVSSVVNAAPIFTGGDLVVTQVGDGINPLSGNAFAVTLAQYDPTTVNQLLPNATVALPAAAAAPTSGNRNLLISGAANTEGILKLSGNGAYLVLAGYNSTPGTGGPNSASSLTTNRVVGLVDPNGNVDTTTALNDVASAQNVRSAYSTDGNSIWVGGNGGNGVTINAVSVTTNGVHYTTRGSSNSANTGTTSTGLNTSGLTANLRSLAGFNGQLYVSSNNTSGTGAPNKGVDTVGAAGSGFPTVAPQINTNIPTLPSNPGTIADYWFKDANTLYIADTRAFVAGGGTGSGGVQKWAFVDTNADSTPDTWQFQYALSVGNNDSLAGAGLAGAAGLTGMVDGLGNILLYATTFDTNAGTGAAGAAQTNLVEITDTGVSSLPTLLATSAANTAFRGVAFAPTPEPGSLALLSLAGLAMLRRRGSKA